LSGIRLHHPTLRAGEGTTLTYVVELPLDYAKEEGARDRTKQNCPTCGKPHLRKALHLHLDAAGDVIVAPAIYEQLKSIPTMAGLELSNEVAEPPPLLIGAVHRDKARIIEVPLSGNGKAHITPEHTKYEARDRLQAPFVPVLDELNLKADKKASVKRREKKSTFIISKKGESSG